MVDLGALAFDGGDDSGATDINNGGQIVGQSYVQVGAQVKRHAVVFENGLITDLGCLTMFSNCAALAINESGVIVGQDSNPSRATIWVNALILDLNTLIPQSGWDLRTARDINSAGEIVGEGVNPDGFFRGFLLTPIS